MICTPVSKVIVFRGCVQDQLAVIVGTMPQAMRLRLESCLKAAFARVVDREVVAPLDTRQVTEETPGLKGAPPTFKCVHFAWWARSATRVSVLFVTTWSRYSHAGVIHVTLGG